jgi:signal transduction histidine kinase
MLELARIDAGGLEFKRASVNVNQLASGIAEEFQVQAKAAELSLQFEPAEGDPEIQADQFQLQQALRNLVSNAIKFTPKKGSILLSVQACQDGVSIIVKDNGCGIPQNDLPFIFERFYRSYNDQNKDIEGDGLGLAIVKSIVEHHAGKVFVESEYGKGSCFKVILPA